MLSAADRARLEARLAERERATGAQMVVAVFPSLEGDSLEDASFRLAEAWKVGRKGADNGLVLVVFLKERKLRIEVGYGLEPVIPDIVAAGIIRDVIAPRFREQRYAAGLEAAVDEIFARIAGTAPARARGPARSTAPSASTILLMVLVFGVLGVAALSVLRSAVGGRHGYTVDRRGWRSGPPIVWGGGGPWGGGGGGGGGGFSGGGGSFGGGGASGNW